MGFWKKLFSRTEEKQDIQVVNKSTIATESDQEEEQELRYDDNGWLIYPNGVKLIINDDESVAPLDITEKLGYKSSELYVSFHNSEGKGIEDGVNPRDMNVTCYWELFSNQLVCLSRQDDHIMTNREINDCIRFHKKHIKESFDIPGMTAEAMMSLEDGIKNQNIRQCFIEKCFNQKSDNNMLSANMFTFIFSENYLFKCFYDGYSFNTWNNVYFLHELNDYFNAFKKLGYGWSNKKIKTLIDKQAEYSLKIDDDIRDSYRTMRMFSYDGGLLFNYIAVAAIYNQCDVSQELFIESTFGRYVILSRTNNNGITTTKIRAYNNTITFYNGHTELEQTIPVKQDNSLELNGELDENEGFIYVMINPSLEGMVKIGKTTRDPNDRVKELSSATGVPTPFVLVFQKKFKNCHYTEKAIHQYLEKNGYRISNNREFFKMPVTDAINVVQQFYDVENEEQTN